MLKCNEPGECNFDLLLVDFRLPEMNALEIVKIVRQEYQSEIPIIIVTGEGNEETAIQALKLGAAFARGEIKVETGNDEITLETSAPTAV